MTSVHHILYRSSVDHKKKLPKVQSVRRYVAIGVVSKMGNKICCSLRDFLARDHLNGLPVASVAKIVVGTN
jgi:hypothetical protein